jgi:hypothetical protein
MAVAIAVAKDGEIAVGHDTCWGYDQTPDGRVRVIRLGQHDKSLGLVVASNAPVGVADVLFDALRGIIEGYGPGVWRKEWTRYCCSPDDPIFGGLRLSDEGIPYELLVVMDGKMHVAVTDGGAFERREVATIGPDWEKAAGAAQALLAHRPDMTADEVVQFAIKVTSSIAETTNPEVRTVVITDDLEGLVPPLDLEE